MHTVHEEANATNAVVLERVGALQNCATNKSICISQLEQTLQNVGGNVDNHSVAIQEQQQVLNELLELQSALETRLQDARPIDPRVNDPNIVGNILNAGSSSQPALSTTPGINPRCATPAPPYMDSSANPANPNMIPIPDHDQVPRAAPCHIHPERASFILSRKNPCPLPLLAQPRKPPPAALL